ncbi:MAG: hypothetical protein ACJ8FS_10680 [Sphingomicrobium sp.]
MSKFNRITPNSTPARPTLTQAALAVVILARVVWCDGSRVGLRPEERDGSGE